MPEIGGFSFTAVDNKTIKLNNDGQIEVNVDDTTLEYNATNGVQTKVSRNLFIKKLLNDSTVLDTSKELTDFTTEVLNSGLYLVSCEGLYKISATGSTNFYVDIYLNDTLKKSLYILADNIQNRCFFIRDYFEISEEDIIKIIHRDVGSSKSSTILLGATFVLEKINNLS